MQDHILMHDGQVTIYVLYDLRLCVLQNVIFTVTSPSKLSYSGQTDPAGRGFL